MITGFLFGFGFTFGVIAALAASLGIAFTVVITMLSIEAKKDRKAANVLRAAIEERKWKS